MIFNNCNVRVCYYCSNQPKMTTQGDRIHPTDPKVHPLPADPPLPSQIVLKINYL